MKLQIRRAKSFDRCFRKLDSRKKKKVIETLRLFSVDPYNPKLKNHNLKGKMKNISSISAEFDLRIIFCKEGEGEILLLRVGSHDQVYV